MLGFEKLFQGPKLFCKIFLVLHFLNSFPAPALHNCSILLFIQDVPSDLILNIAPIHSARWKIIKLNEKKLFVKGCNKQVWMQKVNLLFESENDISFILGLEDDECYYSFVCLEKIDQNPLNLPMIFISGKQIFKMSRSGTSIYIKAEKIDFDDNYD